MPKRSQRWVHLDGLRHLRYLSIFLDDADDDGGRPMLGPDDLLNVLGCSEHGDRFDEYGMPDLIDLSCIVELTRWNHRAPYRAQLSDALAQRAITDRMLQAWCHMNRTSFDYIYSLIRKHPNFIGTDGRPQVSCKMQLFSALARFCTRNLSVTKFGETFKISHGSLLTYSERVIGALLAVEGKFIRWPNAARRRRLRDYGLSEFGFQGYIGNQDGTHFYFAKAPAFCCFPEAYYDSMHSGGYGYNVLLTSDHTGSIIHYALGWPGSVHDCIIQQATELFRKSDKFFSTGEYLFADTGFVRTSTCVIPYKEPAASQPLNNAFNHAMRKGRCRIEHVNAVVKSRFSSCKAIPVSILSGEDHTRVGEWIRACLILHNILVQLKDEWEFTDKKSKKKRVDRDDPLSDDSLGEDGDVTGEAFQRMVRDNWHDYVSRK